MFLIATNNLQLEDKSPLGYYTTLTGKQLPTLQNRTLPMKYSHTRQSA